MATAAPSLLQRHLRRVMSQARTSQHRHRASLISVDLKPTPDVTKIKDYDVGKDKNYDAGEIKNSDIGKSKSHGDEKVENYDFGKFRGYDARKFRRYDGGKVESCEVGKIERCDVGKVKSYDELPTPRGYPLLGTLPQLLRSGGTQYYHQYVSRRHRELGGIYRETLAGAELVFVSDPSAIRQVFASEGPHPKHFIPQAWLLYNKDRKVTRGFSSCTELPKLKMKASVDPREGEEWKTNRSILNRRLLRPESLSPHLCAFSRVADSLVQRWLTLFPGAIVPDLERELYRWAIESLGVMVFGERLGLLQSGGAKPRVGGDMEEFIHAIHGIFKETSAMGTLPPSLARLLKLPVWTRFTTCVDRALASGRELVEGGVASSLARQRAGEASHTLLDYLLREPHLNHETIISLITDLFLAAADTTSHTTVWSLYLLGRHPEEAQRARQEVLEATGGSGVVEARHLSSLPYLKGVVKEALRLYPVAPFQTRALHRDAIILGHHIPAGTMVILSVYTTGRDPAHFPSPHQFCPERWVREYCQPTTPSPNKPTEVTTSSPGKPCTSGPNKLHSHAFLPFGHGVRSCIGRRVAETQLHLLLAKLLARSNLAAVNEVDMVMRMVGVTSQPLHLRIDPLPAE